MHRRSTRSKVAMVVAVCSLLVAACSSSSNDATAPGGTAADGTAGPPAKQPFDPAAVATASVAAPPVEGNGATVLGPGLFDLASVGYEQTELFVSGEATSYTADQELTSDGRWTVAEDESAPYTTRIVVRRPIDPADFNGTVYVEWLNVTGGLDIGPDWTFGHVEMIREGAAWVGVSAQVVGIDGAGGPGAILALKSADPARYGPLDHPGDDYSFDIFSQVGAALRTQPDVLGGLTPERLIALGESQSASRLTTYVNGIAPITNVYDGYLLHSRGGGSAPLNLGTRVGTRDNSTPPKVATPTPTMVRDDLGVPVLVLSSESDVVGRGLGYRQAYQPDTDVFRSWEVAGTAHLDAYGLGIGDTDDGSIAGDTAAFAAMSDAPTTVYFGVVECDAPINSGPHTYVTRSALHHLEAWVRTGEPPPEMPRLEVDAAGDAYVLDDDGNARGGIRTPHVDAPIATLSGSGQSGDSFCFLFGTTVTFDAATLAARYPDHATFVEQWNAATDAAVETGALLEPDAERLKAVAAASTIGD